jgi:hypothetical protein
MIANIYTNGDSERFLGEYISGIRSECVVATKFSINPNMGGGMPGSIGGRVNPNAGKDYYNFNLFITYKTIFLIVYPVNSRWKPSQEYA